MKNTKTLTKKNLDNLFEDIVFWRDESFEYFENCVKNAWGKDALESKTFKEWMLDYD